MLEVESPPSHISTNIDRTDVKPRHLCYSWTNSCILGEALMAWTLFHLWRPYVIRRLPTGPCSRDILSCYRLQIHKYTIDVRLSGYALNWESYTPLPYPTCVTANIQSIITHHSAEYNLILNDFKNRFNKLKNEGLATTLRRILPRQVRSSMTVER